MLFRALMVMAVWLMTSLSMTHAAEVRLVMVEEAGCVWCQRWNEEIAHIYPKTDEGRAAPLLRMDIHKPRPEGLSFARPLQYTPTFVLMRDGQEVNRVEGYPGADFFWGLLARMLNQAGITWEPPVVEVIEG